MTNFKIKKSCTNKEYSNFAILCNQNNLRIEQSENFYYGLVEYEKFEGDTIVNILDTKEYQDAINLIEIEKLKDNLTELDSKSLRSLRSILTSLDNPPDEDLTILQNYEKQANEYRLQISMLENTTTEREEQT